MTMMNKTTDWWRKSVVYQVYPKSFNDSNGDGLGDLLGIDQKIDYLANLGIDVLWLNPIYQSPQVDNGYDIADYYQIEPSLGAMTDFDQLLQHAHQHNIKVLLDLVVNHTSNQHAWFQEALKSKANPYHDYYIWKDGDGTTPPNNWGSSFGGSAWTYVPALKQYYLHLFAKEQPDLNWENPRMRTAIYQMMDWWLAKGVDGFRMDVISLISKKPNYPNGPAKAGSPFGNYYSGAANGPQVHAYLREMHRTVLAHYPVMTVGETPNTTAQQAVKYSAVDRQELDMVFSFDHMHVDYGSNGKFSTNRFDLVALKKRLSDWQTTMAQNNGWNSLYWSNHDQPRPISRFGDDQHYRIRSAKLLGIALHFLQGTPYIYQGEEIGMTNAQFDQLADYNDLETKTAAELMARNPAITSAECQKAIYLHSRDNARTPMPWDGHGGFTTGQPWLKMNPNFPTINVQKDVNDQHGIYQFYQRLIQLRHTQAVITDGDYQLLMPDDPTVYAYTRRNAETTLLVVTNFSDQSQKRPVPPELRQKAAQILIANCDCVPLMTATTTLELPAWGAVVYQFNQS